MNEDEITQYEAYARIRDHHYAIADVYDKLIQGKTKEVTAEPDFDKAFWEKKKGNKGEFEQTSKKANNNSDLWQQLQAKLKEHDGFWQHKNYRYWFDMKNEDVIDRRKIS